MAIEENSGIQFWDHICQEKILACGGKLSSHVSQPTRSYVRHLINPLGEQTSWLTATTFLNEYSSDSQCRPAVVCFPFQGCKHDSFLAVKRTYTLPSSAHWMKFHDVNRVFFHCRRQHQGVETFKCRHALKGVDRPFWLRGRASGSELHVFCFQSSLLSELPCWRTARETAKASVLSLKWLEIHSVQPWGLTEHSSALFLAHQSQSGHAFMACWCALKTRRLRTLCIVTAVLQTEIYVCVTGLFIDEESRGDALLI